VSRAALVALALAALMAGPGVRYSGADFTAAAPSPANSFAAAADFNTVAVAMTDPGTPLHGTVALQATATSERGIERVRFESSPAGSDSWTTACQDTAPPYACDWDTAAVADGARDLRAVAVDQAGYERASVVAARTVDNGAPTITFDDPGAWLEGTEVLSASASDAHTGVGALQIAYRPAGGSWTELCTGPSPRTCPLETTALPDGPYELHVSVTDGAGNASTTVRSRTIDNAGPTVSLGPLGQVRGTIAVPIDASDGAGTGIASVTAELQASGGGSWSPVCVDAQCAAVDTTQIADGLYDARAIAVDGAGRSTTSSVIAVRVDNGAPAAPTLTDPGSLLQGAAALGGTATDPGSGIASWTVQYRPAGGGAWTDACSDTTPAYGCSWSTTGVADGLYDLRALARDLAGNTTASAPLAGRRVDNNGPTVALSDPGSPLRGTVALAATASDPAGVQSVVFARRPAGGGSWTTVCTDGATPFTCAFDTTVVADGSYDLRARAVDTVAHESTAVVTGRQLDNTPPAGADVQTGNGGATAGRAESGDWVRLTWTEPIAPGSVLSGWDGSPIAVRALLENRNSKDELDFYDATAGVRLNLVATNADLKLNDNFVTTSADFDATMTRNGASITITLGAKRSGTVVTASAAHVTWKPSPLVLDFAGNVGASGQVAESGALDLDF
jgi:hypothetical protein